MGRGQARPTLFSPFFFFVVLFSPNFFFLGGQKKKGAQISFPEKKVLPEQARGRA